MTTPQQASVCYALKWYRPEEFHHGDCFGADAQAHRYALLCDPTVKIVIHPPVDPRKRAYCSGALLLEEKPYLVRNKEIVGMSDVILAAPKDLEELRSGTWSTIRYAAKKLKPVLIVYPDGGGLWVPQNAGPAWRDLVSYWNPPEPIPTHGARVTR